MRIISCKGSCKHEVRFARSERQCERSASKSSWSNSEEDDEVRVDLQAAGGLAEVWRTVKSLITNGPYMFLVLYGTLDAILVNGFVAFGAKYFQQQFGFTASMAGIVFGQSLNFHSNLCYR